MTEEPTRPRRAKPKRGPPQKALIIIDHGSKRDEANEMLVSVARLVQDRVGSSVLVRPAHMELAPPTLKDAVDECIRAGVHEIIIHPYMLAPGRHVTEDIPRLASEAMSKHPDIPYRVTPALGLHPLLVDMVLFRSSLLPDE